MSPSLLSKKGKVLKSKLFRFVSKCCQCLTGHSGEFGNGAKLVGKMSKSVMQLISINF